MGKHELTEYEQGLKDLIIYSNYSGAYLTPDKIYRLCNGRYKKDDIYEYNRLRQTLTQYPRLFVTITTAKFFVGCNPNKKDVKNMLKALKIINKFIKNEQVEKAGLEVCALIKMMCLKDNIPCIGYKKEFAKYIDEYPTDLVYYYSKAYNCACRRIRMFELRYKIDLNIKIEPLTLLLSKHPTIQQVEHEFKRLDYMRTEILLRLYQNEREA